MARSFVIEYRAIRDLHRRCGADDPSGAQWSQRVSPAAGLDRPPMASFGREELCAHIQLLPSLR